RRDFTANALYYSIDDFSIWDYVGGVPDARDRVLRLIGDPTTRYREDPVRILRAIRFAAKLDFTMHAATAAPIPELSWMLDGVPPARLFDEVTKMLLAGSGARSFELMLELGVLEHLFPDLAAALASAPTSTAARLVRLGLEGTDARVAADRPVTPSFLFAVLLWPVLRARLDLVEGDGLPDVRTLQDACDQAAFRQQARVAVPRRFVQPMREMLSLQPRFERRDGRRALRLLEHPRFRAAYDFLALRAAAGEVDPELAAWWTEVQTLSAEERIAHVERRTGSAAGTSETPRRPRRRRRRRKPAST
ncbi:MAG TPA: polynucleotide adenylyltransferase PcnB, partial [Steroidobacteraceae bacterium]|nr:polynucleotide adenylyltransferase PcnB [Steroidobacteraceae bacterium]